MSAAQASQHVESAPPYPPQWHPQTDSKSEAQFSTPAMPGYAQPQMAAVGGASFPQQAMQQYPQTPSAGYTGGAMPSVALPGSNGGYPPAVVYVTPVGGQQRGVNDAAGVGVQYQNALLAQCALGNHQVTTTYGPCGIITAICLFPIGLIALLLDVQRKCSRCGMTLP